MYIDDANKICTRNKKSVVTFYKKKSLPSCLVFFVGSFSSTIDALCFSFLLFSSGQWFLQWPYFWQLSIVLMKCLSLDLASSLSQTSFCLWSYWILLWRLDHRTSFEVSLLHWSLILLEHSKSLIHRTLFLARMRPILVFHALKLEAQSSLFSDFIEFIMACLTWSNPGFDQKSKLHVLAFWEYQEMH